MVKSKNNLKGIQYLKAFHKIIKKTGRPSLYKSIIAIEPTYRCNLSCSVCFYKKNIYARKELKVEDFIKFLKKVPNLISVYFPGREPLIKKDFFKIIYFLSKKNIPMLLLTNGTLINEKNCSPLLYNKNNIIMLSLDGDENLHNQIRGASFAYGKVTKAIKLLKNKCKLNIVCVISEKNLSDLWKIPQIIKSLGLNKVIFEYERKYTRKDIESSRKIIGGKATFSDLKVSESNMPHYSLADLKNNIEKMENEAHKYGIKVDYLPAYFKKELPRIYYRQLRKKYSCSCAYLNKMRIDPSGNFIHCFAVRRPLGNILNAKLSEVWYSRKYINFRKALLRNNLLPICETCWGLTIVSKKT